MKSTAEVAVGAKVSAAATKVAPASASSTVTYTSSDSEVATVDASGEVTGVKAGEATITATMKCGTETRTATTKVSVKNVILDSVRQTKVDTVEAVVAGNTKDIKSADVKITNSTTQKTYNVKSVAVDSADATKIIVTTFEKMNDNREYTVEIEGVKKNFTATDGTVAAVGLEKNQIVVATETKINAELRDTNGVVLDTVTYPGNGNTVTIDINTQNGYTTTDSLYLYNIGDTATVDITYYTGQYDSSTGAAIVGAEAKGLVITAVAAETISINGWAVKIAASGKDNFDQLQTTKLAVNDTGKSAYIQMTDSKNIKSSNISNYTIESSDTDSLIILGTNPVTGEVQLNPVKAGTYYLLVRDNVTNNVVTTLPIQVDAVRRATSLTLDKNTVTLSKAINEKADVELILRDQYGEKMEVEGAVTEIVSATNNANTQSNLDNLVGNAVQNNKLRFSADGVDVATYNVRITVGTFSRMLTVRVVNVADSTVAARYELDLPVTTADAVITPGNTVPTILSGHVYETKGGVRSAIITGSALKVELLDSNGRDVSVVSGSSVGVTVEGDGIEIKVANPDNGDKLAAGTYRLRISGVGVNFTFTRNIVITDSQPSVSVRRTQTGGASVDVCFEFSYLGNVISPTVSYYNNRGVEITSASSGSVAVSYAVVTFTLGTGEDQVTVTQRVSIGNTVTIG